MEPKMDARKRARLESKGWHVGDVQEFLGLNDEEMRTIEMHERLAEEFDQSPRNSTAKFERSPKRKK
jgi:hypothetical protein